VLIQLGEIESAAQATAEFVGDTDKMFDCLNSCRLNVDKIKMSYAMTADSPHETFLNEMITNISTAKFIGAHRRIPPCLKNWQISITSILQLARGLRETHNIPKLLTRQLNQDPLEKNFSVVRYQHGCCHNPNPQQFQNGLRQNYITSIAKLSSNTNCENDFTVMLLVTKLSNIAKIERVNNTNEDMSSIDFKDLTNLMEKVTISDENATCYASGFVVRKFLQLHNCETCRTILVDKDKLLTGEHQLFTYFKQSQDIEYEKGLIFVSEEAHAFITKIEVIHNNIFPKLLQTNNTSISKDIIGIIKDVYSVNLTRCSEESSGLFLSLFVKIRCHWAVRFRNKSKIKKAATKN
jgi:hypothetical protein